MKNLIQRAAAAALVGVAALVSAVPVLADQQAYISEKNAKRAVKLLKKKKQIKHLCEPCGDAEVRTMDIATIEAVKTGYEDYWEVRINGKGVDLAYIFYRKKKAKWLNVAKKLDLEVDGVSKYIPESMLE